VWAVLENIKKQHLVTSRIALCSTLQHCFFSLQSEEGISAEDRGGGDDDGGWWMWMATEGTMKTIELFIGVDL
jgi:hypothetical protein